MPEQMFVRNPETGAFQGANHWMCSDCRTIFGGQDAESRAATCCRPKCAACGVDIKRRGYTVCDGCRKKADAEKRAQRLAAATEIPDWSGPVYWDGENQPDESTFGERWWESAESFAECWEADSFSLTEDDDGNEVVVQPVEFVFCGKMTQLKLDLEESWDSLADAGYEDMMDCVGGEKKLFAAVDAFNKLNQKALEVWQPDYTKKVRVPRI